MTKTLSRFLAVCATAAVSAAVSAGAMMLSASRRRFGFRISVAISAMLASFLCTMQPVQAAVYVNGTATANFTVTLTLLANCTIAAAPLNFGNAGVLSTAINQQANLTVTCTNTTPYNVGLDAGTVTGSTVANRLLAGTATGNTGTTIPYQLYQETGHVTVWGNTQGTNTVAGTGTGAAQTLTIYGQVPVNATTPRPDTYQSVVTATVYF